jgi:predicted protein tyrosine phosphatase
MMSGKNVLVLCYAGFRRSSIGARILRNYGYNTRYKGVQEGVSNQVQEEDVIWADIIVGMTLIQVESLVEEYRFLRFDEKKGSYYSPHNRRIQVVELDCPDSFPYGYDEASFALEVRKQLEEAGLI